MKLGEVLHGWRMEQVLTTRDAAKAIGVSCATISRIENGRPITGESMATIFLWLIHGGNKGLANDHTP